MPFFRLLTALFLLLSLSSCMKQPYLKEKSAFIVFKTPSFKFADMGFIYENKEEIKLEIYTMGQVMMSLRVSNSHVCLSLLECMSHESFNQKVLSADYPKETLSNILRGLSIFDKEGYKGEKQHFKQHIFKKDSYDIDYKVLDDSIVFNDKMNDILIKVKRQ